MIRILFAFLVLLGSVWLGIQLNKDPGYVLIGINQWTMETTVWIAIFLLILLFLVLHLILRLLQNISQAPGFLKKWHNRRLGQKAQATTRKGLIEFSEGYWQKAKNHLIKALPNTDTPLINYLTAARAAQKMGDSTLRDHYLREAQQSMPEAKIAVELTQAQLQLDHHQWEQALATLRHLQDMAPNHPYVLELLMNLYEQVRDWKHLIKLLPDLKRNQVLTATAFTQLEQKTYLQAFIDLAKQNQKEEINALFLSLPRSLTNNPAIIYQYVSYLINNHDYNNAETILKRCLRKEFNDQLIELYGQIHSDEQQLEFAESLVKKAPHSAALYLCLGRLCLARHLWGKARSYLEHSIEINPTPIAYIELGKLHEKLDDPLMASDNFKKGLELATVDPRIAAQTL